MEKQQMEGAEEDTEENDWREAGGVPTCCPLLTDAMIVGRACHPCPSHTLRQATATHIRTTTCLRNTGSCVASSQAVLAPTVCDDARPRMPSEPTLAQPQAPHRDSPGDR